MYLNGGIEPLIEMVKSMISVTDLPISFWGHALEITTYTLNCVSSKSTDKTSYELWTKQKSNLNYLRIWDYKVYVKKLTLNKLSIKSKKCFFMGYLNVTKGYCFYHLEE